MLFGIIVWLLPAAAQVAPSLPRREDPDTLRERAAWFYNQRALPGKKIPSGARLHALEQLRALLADQKAGELGTQRPMAPWTLYGTPDFVPLPGDAAGGFPTSTGRVTSLVVNPNNSSQVYVGGADGGVWRSTDSGAHWTPLSDNQPSLAIGGISIDPTNAQIIYAGTGETDYAGDGYLGTGILKSTDGGNTWTDLGASYFGRCNSFSGSRIGAIAVNPVNNQILLAPVQGCPQPGVYRSTNGGNTWTPIAALTGSAPGAAIVWTGGSTAYVALSAINGDAANGVYMTTNGGDTWAPANGTGLNVLPTGNSAGQTALVAAPSNPLVLYASIANPNGNDFLGLYKTLDGGMNWTLTTAPDFCSGQCYYNMAIAVSPVDPNVVYGTGIYDYNHGLQTTVIGSTDGGATWTLLGASTGNSPNLLHTDGHALAFSADGNHLYVGTDGGVWRTDTPTDLANLNWEDLNSTLALLQYFPGYGYYESIGAVGGTQDEGSLAIVPGQPWTAVACGDGAAGAIDPTIGPSFYTDCIAGLPLKSTTPLTIGSWLSADNGINGNDQKNFDPPITVDTSLSNTLYYGTNRVYQTLNGGADWSAISPQPLPGSIFPISTIAALGPVIYAGTIDWQVVRTLDGGNLWTNVWNNLPPRYVTHVAIDPTRARTALVTYSGFSGPSDNLGHVFRTTNDGASWTDISGKLPNIPVNDIVVDPAGRATLYIATDIGVFVTKNNGAKWSVLSTGLPNAAVTSLVLDQSSRSLLAATHGRGSWVLKLSGL